MYTSVVELPSQVTASLNDKDANAWMHAYNACIASIKDPSPKDVMAARRKAWYSVKDRPSSYSFCAKASVEAVDKQKELITLKSIRDKMDDYIFHGGPMSWDHSSYTIGTIWGWDDIDTPNGPGIQAWGNLFGGDQFIYKQTRKRFGKGATMLSVSGPATKVPTCDMDHGCYIRRDMEQLMEIALTPHPVNEYATLVWNSDALSDTRKSMGADATLSVYSMMVHRSEDDCPIMCLKKSLCDIGADAHARLGGVFIRTDDVMNTIRNARDKGLYAYMTTDRLGDGVFVREPTALLEEEFKKAYSSGICDARGCLSYGIGKEAFIDLCDKGVLEKRENGWGFRVPL